MAGSHVVVIPVVTSYTKGRFDWCPGSDGRVWGRKESAPLIECCLAGCYKSPLQLLLEKTLAPAWLPRHLDFWSGRGPRTLYFQIAPRIVLVHRKMGDSGVKGIDQILPVFC